MFKNRLFLVFSLLMIVSMLFTACQPQTQEIIKTVVVTEVVTEEGEEVVKEVVKEVVVTATPEPEAMEPKVMVVCMAQEPASLYSYEGSALVKTAVLEAVYDFGVDSRTFEYQPVGLVKLPSFDDGDAKKIEVPVAVGDTVVDVALDELVTIAPTSTVTLAQVEGDPIEYDFSTNPTDAKTVKLEVTYQMVEGITWEDGTPVTTADILFSYEVGKSPDTATSKYGYERTESLVAVDDRTWTWTTMPGYTSGTYFQDGVWGPLPSHLYGASGSRPLTPAEMLQDEEVLRDPLAFGPFKVEEWQAGNFIRLVKNETYYRASEGLPKLDELIYRFVPDTNQLIAQLASGECDLGTQDGAFEGSLPLIRQFEAQGLLVPQVVAGTVYEHIDFNTFPVDTYQGFAGSVKNDDGSPIFASVDIRKAINYCLDKQAIVDQTTNGAAVVQHVYVPSDHPLYAGDENLNIIPFDPAKGMEILAANGWTDSDGDGFLDKNGVKFSFVHSTRTNALRQKVTQVVQAQLKDNCMIETTIELYGSEFFADGPEGLVFGRQYDFGEFAWLTGVEPPCNLYWTAGIPQDGSWGGQNNTGWSNAEFDAACSTAQSTLDETQKAEQHALAQQIFMDNVPSIVLFARAKILVTRPEVVGVIMDPTVNSEMWNVENFDIQK
jgi:peptide/nickel transport system substrate-binding protein